jgi:two-component system response regulator TctD
LKQARAARIATHDVALVIREDPSLGPSLRRHLARSGFEVVEAGTSTDELRRVAESAPALVLLDLATTDGSALCRRVRGMPSIGDVPMLVLSPRDEVLGKVLLFALGADDHLVKPFDPAELVARMRALNRRRGGDRVTRRVGPLRVAIATGDAWIEGRQLDLTTGERALLVQLARSYPALTPRATLDRVPWREGGAASNVTEVLISRLRQKLSDAGGGVEIRVVPRTGYVLRPTAFGPTA